MSHAGASAAGAGLSLRGVTRRYAEHTVVRQLDLEIPAGAFVALLGPSGCGKTTTLRMIAGFEAPDDGEIRLGGALLADARRQLPPEQRQMGMVFQSYALWPHLSVADNVGYPLKLRGVRGADYRRRVQQALAQVQLDSRAEAMPQALSGGQRQRVALARCLVAEPRVVLLDEPLANLDRHLRAAMESTFREFHRRTGATFVYVTHDQDEAMALADQVAVMRQGELVQWATPQQLYAQPASAWLAGFIGAGRVLQLPLTQFAAGQLLPGPLLMASLAAAAGAGLQPPAARQAVLVRPEHVVVAPAFSPPAGALNARVLECVFQGERHVLRLALPGASEAHELLAYDRQTWPAGASVAVTLLQGWGLPQAG